MWHNLLAPIRGRRGNHKRRPDARHWAHGNCKVFSRRVSLEGDIAFDVFIEIYGMGQLHQIILSDLWSECSLPAKRRQLSGASLGRPNGGYPDQFADTDIVQNVHLLGDLLPVLAGRAKKPTFEVPAISALVQSCLEITKLAARTTTLVPAEIGGLLNVRTREE